MEWLLLVPAYFLGTFPSAVMVARSRGVDIYNAGSGNPGASNVARVLGNRYGVLVFLLDGLKGAIPAAVGVHLLDDRPLAYAMVAAAIVGHMFPITRRFRGGKGVATFAGASLVFYPIVWIIVGPLWYVVRKLTGKASLATFSLGIAWPIGVAIAGAPLWEIAAIVGISLLVLVRHTDNIRRLISGTELSGSHGG
jgi:glycerol-3-phosphate acyltransferase PlsY